MVPDIALLFLWDQKGRRVFGPSGEGFRCLVEDTQGGCARDGRRVRQLQEVIANEAPAFALYGHAVMAGQACVVGEVVGGGIDPLAVRLHLEGEVPGVIVAIAADYIEHHAPEQLDLLGVGTRQPVAELEEFEVIEVRHSEVGMHQAGDAVDVPVPIAGEPVEASGYEVGVALAPRDQPCFSHSDSRGAGHSRVQVLDCAGGPVAR